VLQKASRRLKSLVESNPPRARLLVEEILSQGYKSHAWQYVKRVIADDIVECIVEADQECFGGCLERVYLADLTGGEHSYIQGHGGKDLDIILYAPCPDLDRERLEEEIEKALEPIVRLAIEEALGFDPIKTLGIPNVVEIHIVRDRRDHPYWNMVHSRVSRLIKVWEKRSVGGYMLGG